MIILLWISKFLLWLITGSWTTPATWTAGQIPGASDFNTQIRDNMNYLLSGKALGGHNGQLTVWTTTSTSYVDTDGTNLSATLTINTGRMGLFIEGYLSLSNVVARWGQFTVIVDGVDQGDATYGYLRIPTNTQRQFSYHLVFTGLSAGSHTVKLQWKTSNNDVTLALGESSGNSQRLTQFRAWEF